MILMILYYCYGIGFVVIDNLVYCACQYIRAIFLIVQYRFTLHTRLPSIIIQVPKLTTYYV